MIIKSCDYQIKENTVDLFVEVEVKGEKQTFKFKTFIFNDLVKDCLSREDKCLFDLITDEQMNLSISDEDYDLITNGLLQVPHTIVDLTKSNIDF